MRFAPLAVAYALSPLFPFSLFRLALPFFRPVDSFASSSFPCPCSMCRMPRILGVLWAVAGWPRVIPSLGASPLHLCLARPCCCLRRFSVIDPAGFLYNAQWAPDVSASGTALSLLWLLILLSSHLALSLRLPPSFFARFSRSCCVFLQNWFGSKNIIFDPLLINPICRLSAGP